MKLTGWKGTAGHVTVTFAVVLLCSELGIMLTAFFFGRELAQAEYRYIEAHGGERYACPWYCGFMLEAWTLKAVFDWFLPLVAACAVYAAR